MRIFAVAKFVLAAGCKNSKGTQIASTSGLGHSRRILHAVGTPGAGGSAILNRTKADVGALMSLAEGTTVDDTTTPNGRE